MDLRGRNFLTLLDYSSMEIKYLLDKAAEVKRDRNKRRRGVGELHGKTIVILFEKPSTRTRSAFEVGAVEEGAKVIYMTNSHVGKKESIADTGKVYAGYYDGIAFRGFKHETVEDLAKNAKIPVWNGLTDEFHPTQVLADFMTMKENVDKPFDKMKLVYVGDGRNNMAISLMIMAAKMGTDITVLAPKELHLKDEKLLRRIKEVAAKTGSHIEMEEDIAKGVKGADAIQTDVWFSMGEDHSVIAPRIKMLTPYRVNKKMMDLTGNPDVIFLHCLPSFHDTKTVMGKEIADEYGVQEMEVSDEVFQSPASKVFEEAENRLHTIKAIMVETLKD